MNTRMNDSVSLVASLEPTPGVDDRRMEMTNRPTDSMPMRECG
jgi:hypothetical protein